MIKGAKAMALTGYDIFADENLRRNIYEEFTNTVPKYSREELR